MKKRNNYGNIVFVHNSNLKSQKIIIFVKATPHN